MTYRGDYSSDAFRQSLNKVSITFHKDKDTRKQIRELYELINNPATLPETINRKIVGLIYDLCRRNGFRGITEYDIDQSFPEQNQIPTGSNGGLSSAGQVLAGLEEGLTSTKSNLKIDEDTKNKKT